MAESIQDTIAETMKELDAEDAFGPSGEVDPPVGSVAKDDAQESLPLGDDRPRDDQGRFARKDAEAEGDAAPEKEAATEDAGTADAEKSGEEADIDPPAEWKAEDQEAFRKMPKEAKEFVTRQQREWNEKYAPVVERTQRMQQTFEPIARALAPYSEYFQRAGMHPAQYVEQLISLARQAQEQPEQFLREQARAHGVDLAKLVQPAEPAAEEWEDPAVKSVRDEMRAELAKRDAEIQRLTGGVNSYAQQNEMAARQQTQGAVREFVSAADESGKPKHPYFNEVREDMALLLNAGRARDLADAYERAVYANPETRAKLAAAQRVADERRAVKESRERAEQARRAGGSVVGEGAAGPNAPQIPTDSPMATAFAVARNAGWQL